MKLLKENTKEKWEEIRTSDFYKSRREECLSKADEYTRSMIPTMEFSQFRRFHTDGNRKGYENSYFDRRNRLSVLAVASMITEDEKYISALEDVIWAICDEFTWVLPAHLPEDLDMELMPVWIDLFSSETGCALAEINSMLGDKLHKRVRERIEREVRARIIEAFKTRRFGWEKTTNNWAAVCISSVLGAFLYTANEEECEIAIKRAVDTYEYFLSGFSDDGCCEEGYDYWNYGFSMFLVGTDLLKNYTKGKINYFDREKVHNICKFPKKVILQGDTCISFSDGGNKYTYPLGILCHIKNNSPDAYVPTIEYAKDRESRWVSYLRMFLWSDEKYFKNADSESLEEYTLFKDNAWYIRHTENFAFAAKAGHNNEHHNHNDVGSFIFCADNEQILVDFGAGEYTKQYFEGDHMFDILVKRSLGHSVPYINGTEQKAGKEYFGEIISADSNVFEIEISKAYDIKSLTSLKRRFEIYENNVLLKDTYEFGGNPDSVVERFVSWTKPEKKNGTIMIGNHSVTFDENALDVKLSSEDYSNHQAINTTAYFIDFRPKQLSDKFEVEFEIE